MSLEHFPRQVPRCSPESLAAAKASCAEGRSQLAAVDPDDPMCRRHGASAVELLVDAFGAQQVMSWLWMSAALKGQAITMPVQDSEVRR